MSELKAINLNSMGCYNINEPVYLKSEADKVIAELQSKISLASLAEDCSRLRHKRCNYCSELQRQKYKRCMAMAKWCDAKADWYYSICESFRDRVEFYIKWRKRWLKLAEKFKPNN